MRIPRAAVEVKEAPPEPEAEEPEVLGEDRRVGAVGNHLCTLRFTQIVGFTSRQEWGYELKLMIPLKEIDKVPTLLGLVQRAVDVEIYSKMKPRVMPIPKHVDEDDEEVA